MREETSSGTAPMLTIDWTAGPPLPRGMQDNDGGLLDHWLVVAGGFCAGVDSDVEPQRYARGFLRDTYGLDLRHEERSWQRLPDFPGCARQEMVGAVAGKTLYLWGGFSYDAPCTYADGFGLSRLEEAWRWSPLPPLPHPLASASSVTLGDEIYVFGGSDYDGEQFYTAADRCGGCVGLGRQLWRIRASDLQRGRAAWEACAPCPGTPRCNTAMVALQERLVILGGMAVHGEPATYCSVVDNWSYHPGEDRWARLSDSPSSAGGWPYGGNLWRGRYVLLPAGYMYAAVLHPDGSTGSPFGISSQVRETWERHPALRRGYKYYNHVWVYDAAEDRFGTATALPYDDHTPPTFVVGDTVYLLGNETGGFEFGGRYYGHHPEFVLKGHIRLAGTER